MPAVRFTAAGTDINCGMSFLPDAARRSITAMGVPSPDSSMAKPIFSREKPGGSASPRSAIRS